MSFIRGTSRLATGLGIAGATVLLLAGPAAADTSQARATAARITLLNSSILDTGVRTASNDGTTETNAGPGGAGSVLLGGQTLLTAGALVQDADAATNGTSAACAGAVGSGGSIQVGAGLPCTANLGTPDGVTLNLGGALLPNIIPGLPLVNNLVTLGADAIYAECTATTAGETGTSTLVGANLFLTVLGLVPTGTPLAANPGPNTTVNLLNLLTVTTNEQIINPDGSLTVNALHVVLLPALTGSSAADIVIGSVTCGPNAVTAPVSLVSGPALPVALTATAAAGAVVLFRRRRQTA